MFGDLRVEAGEAGGLAGDDEAVRNARDEKEEKDKSEAEKKVEAVVAAAAPKVQAVVDAAAIAEAKSRTTKVPQAAAVDNPVADNDVKAESEESENEVKTSETEVKSEETDGLDHPYPEIV